MTTGIIFDVKHFSIHDGPGIRSTVFFKGCPLSCWWCHNPEGQAQMPELVLRSGRCIGCGACVEVCEHGAIAWEGEAIVTHREGCTACGDCAAVCYAEARELVGHETTVAEVVAAIERDIAFYDESGGGVTFSGGEPLSQPVFLRDLLQACREEALHTAVDTCGFAPWDVLDSVRQEIDLFLYDFKVMDEARHREFTGVSNELILQNLQRLSRSGHDIVLRVPIIPGVNDKREHVLEIGTFVAGLPHLERVDLLPYHGIGQDKYRSLGKVCQMPDVAPPTDEGVYEIARLLRDFDLPVEVE